MNDLNQIFRAYNWGIQEYDTQVSLKLGRFKGLFSASAPDGFIWYYTVIEFKRETSASAIFSLVWTPVKFECIEYLNKTVTNVFIMPFF